MQSTTFFGVAIDCADAAAVAGFWAEVLGRSYASGCGTLACRRAALSKTTHLRQSTERIIRDSPDWPSVRTGLVS